MSRSQNDGPLEDLARIGFYAYDLILTNDEGIHAGFEVDLTPTTQDSISHVLYHTWQFVSPDVGMGID